MDIDQNKLLLFLLANVAVSAVFARIQSRKGYTFWKLWVMAFIASVGISLVFIKIIGI